MEKSSKNGVYLLIGILILGIWYYRERLFLILEPFGWGIVTAFLLMPIAERLEKRKISTGASVGIIYGGISLVVIATFWFGTPVFLDGIKNFMGSLPEIWNRVREMMQKLPMNAIWPYVEKMISSAPKADVMTTITGWVGGVTNFFVGIVLSAYFLKDRKKMSEGTFELLPERYQGEGKEIFKEISTMFGAFIRGRFLLSLCVGILTFLMLTIFHLPYRFALSLLVAAFDILPFFGPLLAGIPIALFAFAESIGKGIGVILVMVLIQEIESLFLTPKIMGDSVGLHPATTILAVLTGATFFGLFGMILAVPVFAAGKILIKRIFSYLV